MPNRLLYALKCMRVRSDETAVHVDPGYNVCLVWYTRKQKQVGKEGLQEAKLRRK
jgi:hypothetical protein